jgi:hypothetical protein
MKAPNGKGGLLMEPGTSRMIFADTLGGPVPLFLV